MRSLTDEGDEVTSNEQMCAGVHGRDMSANVYIGEYQIYYKIYRMYLEFTGMI